MIEISIVFLFKPCSFNCLIASIASCGLTANIINSELFIPLKSFFYISTVKIFTKGYFDNAFAIALPIVPKPIIVIFVFIIIFSL